MNYNLTNTLTLRTMYSTKRLSNVESWRLFVTLTVTPH